MAPAGLITLTTDFGLADAYVGAVKGALLTVNPDAVIVDITHEVRPQAIDQGAFLLSLSAPYFPPGTIHVAVVDPGVGTERRGVAIQTEGATFVGPDNGILSSALGEWSRQAGLPAGVCAVELTNGDYFRQPVSPTFHGRDIFAPVAAHLSLGVPLERLGPALRSIVTVEPFVAVRQADGTLSGRVLHIDRFGNVITSVRRQDLSAAAGPLLTIRDRSIRGLARTYREAPPGLCCIIGSAGYLEVALAGGSAAAQLGAEIGDVVSLRTVA